MTNQRKLYQEHQGLIEDIVNLYGYIVYKKHHPPNLEDDVWRLEKIGKEGAFHKKLAENHIKTVQDFLKLSVVSETKLRKVIVASVSTSNLFFMYIWNQSLLHIC